MKICRLKLKNLNSFRNPVDIDFEKAPLDDASLVAITGPTGAGKTTLLDAICVALYGKTPRLSGTTSQHPRHLISHGETEGFAEVHFEANNTHYHATWSIKRNRSPQSQLFNDSGELITTSVAQEVESILGLDFGAFKRSVMLAQGEFAAFLKASNEERRTILEATTGIHIYDILRQALNDKVNAVETEHQEVLQKLGTIPEVSREQFLQAEAELDRLQTGADALGTESQQIQQKKDRETKRTEDFEKLQSSEKRQEELLDKQPKIDVLQAEQEAANRARQLLPEKQMFDTATSDLEAAEEALRIATTEKTEAEEQVETDQADSDTKEAAYQRASAERDRKVEVYTAAKLNVQRAEERFAEAKKRDPDLADLGKQIDALESELTEKQTEQTQLQERIEEAQTFLDANHLPANSSQRLNDATGLLAELAAYQKQLETVSVSKAQTEKKVSSLKREMKKLSDAHAELLSEEAEVETTLEDATTELNKLLTTGTREEWATRTRQIAKAQPIAQKYEATQNDLADAEKRLDVLNGTAATLDVELGQVETELTNQTEVCQRAAEAVRRCEEEKEVAKWADPINQLRQRLHPGEPCSVCGATDHPFADVVEPESKERLQRAEHALANAKTKADTAQADLQILQTKQIQTEQNKRNTADQTETCTAEIETLQDEAAELLAEWQVIYPDVDVSSKWASEQFIEADTAITAIGEAEQTRAEASHAYEMVSQQLETCENNIANQKKSLRETEKQLQNASDTVEDLEADIKSIETRFWELLPDSFHGVTPKKAVDQFDSKIKEVAAREDEHRKAETDLQVVNVNIEANQGTLQNLKNNRETLKNEKDEYLREAEKSLSAAREKTGGLETGDDINEAIDTLAANLQKKEKARDDAEQQLQNSRNLLTQKQTTHGHCEKQYEESAEKLEMARDAYFNKLEKEGFNTPEAHDDAFRDDDQIQDLTDQINAYEDEMRELASGIRELSARFDENPFDPDALGQIETELTDIETQLQEKQKEIGAQQQKIKGIKDALEKREALGDELGAAQHELERWQRLQETIRANALRDFALEIMFKQMGNLANEQLKYLTSERYQLKVEGIGDLSVVDRWNANEERPVETLSGGESFLTSLALALALSELSRGRSQLNSLFLDEGFGTLDAETLDIAIAALEGLRMQGRNIFLISHIQELTRRLPVKINVRKRGDDDSYGSSIDIRG